jgi:hypothetical protein
MRGQFPEVAAGPDQSGHRGPPRVIEAESFADPEPVPPLRDQLPELVRAGERAPVRGYDDPWPFLIL